MINSTINELAKLLRDAESGKDEGPGGHERIRKKFNLPDDAGKGDNYIPQPGDEGYVAPTTDVLSIHIFVILSLTLKIDSFRKILMFLPNLALALKNCCFGPMNLA